jgi:hypothetical protein
MAASQQWPSGRAPPTAPRRLAADQVYPGCMKLIALERPVPGVPEGAFSPELLRREAARAWELHLTGEIRELYFRGDREEAVLVLEAADAAAGRRILAELPLVQAGLIEFELVPLRAYPGFARLFDAAR